jgi:alkyl hydroperoxide reductase subunit AhpC
MTFAKMMPEFKALNCELVVLSIDSHYAHRLAAHHQGEDQIQGHDLQEDAQGMNQAGLPTG